MIKETVTYTDFNGEEVTDDLYFNLNKMELLEMSALFNDGKVLEEAVKKGDKVAIIKYFKTIILNAYGKKSEDGKKFLKSDEIRKEFENSEAFSEFMFSILSDEGDKAEKLLTGLIPDVASYIKKA